LARALKTILRSAFDRLGVGSRLELAMYVATHGGENWPIEADRPETPIQQSSRRGLG
jgi:hypothetical protein